MVACPLTLEELREVATFLGGLPDKDLEENGFLLTENKFPKFVTNTGRAADVVSLIKYERLRRERQTDKVPVISSG